MPPPPPDEIVQRGFVLICFTEDANCMGKAEVRAGARGKLIEAQIVRNYFGIAGKPQRYAIFIVPPRQ